jgi:hypothetical protein
MARVVAMRFGDGEIRQRLLPLAARDVKGERA